MLRIVVLIILVVLIELPALAQPVPPSTVMPPVRYVNVYGQKMAFYELGQGPTLVLVHGFGTSATIDWGQVIRKFGARYRVIALDNIGFGLSDKPTIAYTNQTFVDFLAEFLRDLGIDHFYIAGESLGGAIAALYTEEANSSMLRMPKVDKLIITDGAILDPKTPSKHLAISAYVPSSEAEYQMAIAKRLFHNPAFVTEAYVRDVYQLLLSYHAAPTAQALYEQVSNLDAADDYLHQHLKDIKIPTFIVWGHDDKLLPVTTVEYLHAEIVGSTTLIVPECGHAPGMEKPDLYVDKVVQFLDARD